MYNKSWRAADRREAPAGGALPGPGERAPCGGPAAHRARATDARGPGARHAHSAPSNTRLSPPPTPTRSPPVLRVWPRNSCLHVPAALTLLCQASASLVLLSARRSRSFSRDCSTARLEWQVALFSIRSASNARCSCNRLLTAQMQQAARDRESIELVERSRRNEAETTVGQLRAEISQLSSQLSVSAQRVSPLQSTRRERECVAV